MIIKLTEKPQIIKSIQEKKFSISVENMENSGHDSEFTFKIYKEDGKQFIYFLFESGKWHKKPPKKLLKRMSLNEETLINLIDEFISLNPVYGLTINSLNLTHLEEDPFDEED